MKTEKLKKLYEIYELTKDDFYKHHGKDGKHQYTIVTRMGIEKIQAIENIDVAYECLECSPNYAAVKGHATRKSGKKIETFASAVKGVTWKDGNTQSWYVLEIAEKRCLSRLVLRYLDLYKEGFFAEDESEEFKKA